MTRKYDSLVQQVQKIIDQYDVALTVRQIYYRLVADYGRRNDKNSYGSLVKMLVKAREEGDINYRSIEDRSRQTIGGDMGYASIQDFIKSQITDFTDLDYYTRRLWDNQDNYVEVWVEKDALSTLISNVANRFRVTTAPSRGYGSFSYVMNAANRFPLGKHIVILHFADHDPSGIDMTRDLENRLERYGADDFEVKRIALTIDQVKERNLIPSPTKFTDSRSRNYNFEYGGKCWELDAIKPDELEDMVKNAIVEEIDRELFDKTIGEIKAEKASLKDKMSEAEQKLLDFFKDLLGEE